MLSSERLSLEEQDPDPDRIVDFDWGSYVAWLVRAHGTLAAVAVRLAEAGGQGEDPQSVERGLRRLRSRGRREGGTWGDRCLDTFGVPRGIEGRARWMGHSHSRFSDLPASICLDLLRPWDRPPIAESPVQAWVELGLAAVKIRGKYVIEAEDHLTRAEGVAEGASRAEALLVRAFIDSRRNPDRVEGHLSRAEDQIRALGHDEDRACLWARLVDQRAQELHRRTRDIEGARELYASLPSFGPPFALVRRSAGLGWCAMATGDRGEATQHAREALEQAGDSGSLRLRAAALDLLARAVRGDEGDRLHVRAVAIAGRLEDEALRVRLLRTQPQG